VKHLESDLQSACIYWFRLAYPKLAGIMFAVPNGGSRNAREARNLKIQGTLPGVADLILLKPSNGYHSLCVEMKIEKGKQSEYQKIFQQAAEQQGNKYIVCRNFEEFKTEIDNYINGIG